MSSDPIIPVLLTDKNSTDHSVIKSLFTEPTMLTERQNHMTYTFKTKGTCSSHIELELEGNIVKEIKFIRGCNGNAQGIAKLAAGMTVEEIREKLGGIRCDGKSTSCPDQLAKAVEMAYNERLGDAD